MEWRGLRRDERRVLERLYGGGSIRNVAPDVLNRLSDLGLITMKGRRSVLTEASLGLLFTEAHRLNGILATSNRVP